MNTVDLQASPGNVPLPQGKTAGIIVDMQRAFLDESDGLIAHIDNGKGTLDIASARLIIPRVQQFIDTCRSAAIPLFWLREGYSADGSDRKPTTLDAVGQQGPRGRYLTYGHWDHQIIDELTPQVTEDIFDKAGKDGMQDRPPKDAPNRFMLPDILHRNHMTHLLFTGVATGVCVDTTARSAASQNYFPILVEDCCADYVQSKHEDALLNYGKQQQAGSIGIFGNSTTLADLMKAVKPWQP